VSNDSRRRGEHSTTKWES